MPVKAIASSRVAINGRLIAATIVYSTASGKIVEIFENEVVHSVGDPRLQRLNVTQYEIVSPHVIMPGLVDSHVHLNEPGRTEWEGFATGTRAAASGGVTTLVDMPLNAIPPTTTVEHLDVKLAAARDQLWCDVAFWGGLVPTNLDQLLPLVRRGVRGFKGFLMDSGVDEFPQIDENYIMNALDVLQKEKTMLLFHAEQCPPSPDHGLTDPSHTDYNFDHVRALEGGEHLAPSQVSALAASKVSASVEPRAGEPSHFVHSHNPCESALKTIAKESEVEGLDRIDPTTYAPFLASRPDEFETSAIQLLISCMTKSIRSYKRIPDVHIAHLSTQEALPILKHAQIDLGLPISAETCFHYLTFAAENIPAKATQYKCCPPIRNEDNRIALWNALRDGTIKTVVSDHSPCTPELKNLAEGDFLTAWGGISSVGLGLSIMITEGAEMNPPVSLIEIIKWCCENTAKQVGLHDVKGFLRVGYDADFVVLDQHRKRIISDGNIFYKNKLTAYDGRELRGQVVATYLRGNIVFDVESGHSTIPLGCTLLEPRRI
ncbi:LADA_0D12420g1_1 [Lachancea dasiensis]|uniref:LADA_0D12420g1_1 n=1 Tax=Lachancea dasiensis TaxID=1072105 RepID=A0A1G4J8H8_9SACH|nr:LADA_0D12420g1_1 [Lachancea dasiensis]